MDTSTTGSWLDLGDGARLDLMTADQGGTLARLEYGYARLVIIPGASEASLEALQASSWGEGVTVLVARGNGLATEVLCAGLGSAPPLVLVVADGEAPSCATERASPGVLLSTLTHGAVRIQTDGREVSVFVARGLAGVDTR